MRLGTRHTPEAREKMSAAHMGNRAWLGRKHTPESKAKNAAAHLGKRHSLTARAKMGLPGELSGAWRGDSVGYNAVHARARKALAGEPCAYQDESCGGRLESAFIKDTPKQRVLSDVRGTYSTHIEDYIRLCDSHHNRYDQGDGS